MKFNKGTQNEISQYINSLRNGALQDAGFEITLKKVNYDNDTCYEYTLTNGKFTIVMARTMKKELFIVLDLSLIPNSSYFQQKLEACKAYHDCYQIASKLGKDDTTAQQTAAVIKEKLDKSKVIDINPNCDNYIDEYKRFGLEDWTPRLYCSDILEYNNAISDIEKIRDSLYSLHGDLCRKYDFQIEDYDPYVIYPEQNNKKSEDDESSRF